MLIGLADAPVPRYPLYVALGGKRVLVVGGGAVAERKVRTLLRYQAQVTLIAPESTLVLSELAADGAIEWRRRAFAPGDCQGCAIVICAVGCRDIDELVYADAQACKALVNVVDVPELCDFYVPSIVDRGSLQIAISTSGASPATARKLRKQLEWQFPPVWERYLLLLAQVRALVLERISGGEAERKPLMERLASLGLLQRLKAGESPEAEAVYQELLAAHDGAVVPATEELAR